MYFHINIQAHCSAFLLHSLTSLTWFSGATPVLCNHPFKVTILPHICDPRTLTNEEQCMEQVILLSVP